VLHLRISNRCLDSGIFAFFFKTYLPLAHRATMVISKKIPLSRRHGHLCLRRALLVEQSNAKAIAYKKYMRKLPFGDVTISIALVKTYQIFILRKKNF
jgi:hypothetical protein